MRLRLLSSDQGVETGSWGGGDAVGSGGSDHPRLP